ncbi:MAG: NAD-dependent epimerase/dehydratase family protein [Ignavibacteria bacterium]|nr:NAD-dependent epimerase/dehydratase family protein [Ignavibacteria bacterium]
MKKILIIGGTGFVGRMVSETLSQDSNYELTLFNRGKRNPGIFQNVKHIQGDRLTDDIQKLSGMKFDCVIDFAGMYPTNIDNTLEVLKGNIGRYIFISTCSVYDFEKAAENNGALTEDSPVYGCTDEQKDSKDLQYYGHNKAECERVILSKDWLDAIIFRPALICGKYDPTDRFYCWLYRAKMNDKILMPESCGSLTQNTFAPDFAKLIIRAINTPQHRKVYNAVTHSPVSIFDVVKTCAKLVNTNPEIVTKPDSFFEENEIRPWMDLAMWLGKMDFLFDMKKAEEDFNVEFDSFETAVEKTIPFYSEKEWQIPKYGLSLEKEKELISK